MRLLPFGLALGLAACAAFSDDASTDAPNETPSAGAEAYGENCASCHGMDGRGVMMSAQDKMESAPPDISLLSANNGGKFPREYVLYVMDGRVEILSHGSREMPLWGTNLGDPDAEKTMNAIADFVESLQRTPKG